MKNKKLILATFFFLTLLIILTFKVFNKNSISENNVKIDDNDILKKNDQNIESTVDNISYSSFDKNGNQFFIKAKKGEIDQKKFKNIKMTDVEAKIVFPNSETVYITSKFANYDKSNSETFFYIDVESIFLKHLIQSQELKFSFKKRIATASKDVEYIGEKSKLIADKILINLDEKKAKVFMFDSSEKVKINYIN